jgi:hypothetical protein
MERDQHHCNSNSIHLPNISAALIVKCKRSRSNAFQQISRAVPGNSENERCNPLCPFVYSCYEFHHSERCPSRYEPSFGAELCRVGVSVPVPAGNRARPGRNGRRK